MFPGRYFSFRFFPGRYFPHVGADRTYIGTGTSRLGYARLGNLPLGHVGSVIVDLGFVVYHGEGHFVVTLSNKVLFTPLFHGEGHLQIPGFNVIKPLGSIVFHGEGHLSASLLLVILLGNINFHGEGHLIWNQLINIVGKIEAVLQEPLQIRIAIARPQNPIAYIYLLERFNSIVNPLGIKESSNEFLP